MKSKFRHTESLVLLAEVIEAGGYASAAERTGISKSLLSRRLMALESELGVILIARNSRHFHVTDSGWRMYTHALRIRDEANAALDVANPQGGEPRGLLRVMCPVALASMFVLPLATDLCSSYRDLRIDIVTTDGRERGQNFPFNLVLQPTTSGLKDSELIARKLLVVPYCLAASPDLAERYSKAKVPADLEGAPAIGWTFSERPARWDLHDVDGASASCNVDLRLQSDNLNLICEAASAGLGIAQLPVLLCRNYRGGNIVPLMPNWAPPTVELYAVYTSRRHLTRGGEVFVEELSTRLKQAGFDIPWG